MERLRAHGVRLERGAAVEAATVQRFHVQEKTVAERVFQGRNEVTMQGGWEEVATGDLSRLEAGGELVAPDDWWVVPMDQPLARLAFLLLEPRSDDGLAAWGLVDPWIGDAFPVLRLVSDR
ncbi:MAG: hypothetical protein EA422_11490 [Gemmatimonadales bacterium]|nr:MAG: hypothetical protein EA422_11490 [Gemmatimonadales bacterium]